MMLLWQTVCATVDVAICILIYCYFGNLVTTKYAEISDRAYQSLWYEQPKKTKRFTILIIQRAQRPFYFTAMGIFKCSLDTMERVEINKLNSSQFQINEFTLFFSL